MPSDLVERLRAEQDQYQLDEWDEPLPHMICIEAADYIESLTAELAEARKRVARLREAQETMDAADAECPARRAYLGNSPCPGCGAKSYQGCLLADQAIHTFLMAAHAILSEDPAQRSNP